jgi:hypothetical protein
MLARQQSKWTFAHVRLGGKYAGITGSGHATISDLEIAALPWHLLADQDATLPAGHRQRPGPGQPAVAHATILLLAGKQSARGRIEPPPRTRVET